MAIERKDVVGTEYKEYAEERTQPASRTLVADRAPASTPKVGRREPRRGHLQHVEANLHWEVVQFLGKLQPTVYVLKQR